MPEPVWLTIARGHLGVREVPGAGTAPVIARWLQRLGAWWRDDATPWCGVAVAEWMREAGQPLPAHWYRARAWLDWGRPLAAPAVGCVVVFERTGGGHVGLVVGRDQRGRLMVLGGNQGDMVSIAPFESSRALGYRWPDGRPPAPEVLPTIQSSAASSRNEA